MGEVSDRSALRSAAACGLIVFINLVAWSIVTPPFQAPDEPTHLAHVQRIAETGQAPRPSELDRPALSSAGMKALELTSFGSVIGNVFAKPPWTERDDRRVSEDLKGSVTGGIPEAPSDDGGGAAAYSGYPPTYYALLAIPYLAAKVGGATIFGELAAARIGSSLLTALAMIAIFMFIRELLPRSRAVWAPATLCVGLMPYVAFIGSSVNNDVLVTFTAALVFLSLALCFRRGLTVRRAVFVGVASALVLISKPTVFPLLAGVALGLAIVAVRAAREDSRVALRSLAAVALGAFVPLAVFMVINTGLWDRPLNPYEAGSVGTAEGAGTSAELQKDRSVTGLFSYAFQFWLPRPSFLTNQVGDVYPLWETMFKGFVGRFGWVDFAFPNWVFNVVLAVWSVLLVLVARALVIGRTTLRQRLPEFITYLVMTLGLLAFVAAFGYVWKLDTEVLVEQARYLFPLLALYGALVGLALNGAGVRLARYLAPTLVILVVTLNIGGLLLSVARYYFY